MLKHDSVQRRDEPLVVIVGAAGLSGINLLHRLRQSASRIRAVVHDEAGAKRANAAGAHETVRVELNEASAVRDALDGADAVYMIPPSMVSNEDALAINVLRAAEYANAGRFVYVSVLHPHTPALRHHMRKARVEDCIRASSLDWSILQPAIYAQMVILMFCSAESGAVRVPFDIASTFSVLDLGDLSEVATKVLTEQGHSYASYELCGPQLSMADMVRTVGRVRGVPLEPVSSAPGLAPMPAKFARDPSSAADMRAMWEEYDRHGLRGNSAVLRMLLGRDPVTFEQTAQNAFAGIRA